MSKPGKEQIKEEAKKFRAMKSSVRHYSIFGDDNHAKIEAEIETLEANLSDSDIYDKGDQHDWSESQVENALYARQWMDGEAQDGSPSEQWAPLVEKK